MKVLLLDTVSAELVDARLLPAVLKDMKTITDGWHFNWRRQFGLPHSKAFKIVTGHPERIEGLLIFQILNKEEPYMAYLESAPHNRGNEKQLDYVAGCLIAKACQLSTLEGIGHFRGFLSFQCMDEEVISVYHHKYGAYRVNTTYMFIDPKTGNELVERYLLREEKQQDEQK
jgi:hypothetical protein